MKKNISYLLWHISSVAFLFCATGVFAQDTFIDCTGPENQVQCAALYQNASFIPPQNEQVMQPNNLNAAQPEAPINAMPNADFTVPGFENNQAVQQVIMHDAAAPIAISQPMNQLEELGEEYAFYKTPTGSLIVETEVTNEEDEDGSLIQVTRKKETTVTPPYVEMPSITEHQRPAKKAFGEQPQDWEAENGDTLRALLVEWGQKSGWTVVWKMDRDYILEAGVVFRGTFTEVAGAIIRTFARATPTPIGTFYKGNRVLVISTQEDDNA